MPVIDKIAVPDADDINNEALSVLMSELGLTKAAFFCRQHLSRPTDYVEFKRENFAEESVATITGRIIAERPTGNMQ